MAFIDYYKILGVDKTIAQKDVKRAYLKRAKQFHPDLHPDDPKAKAKFQALQEAYDVIGDPEKRAKYDKYGEQWQQADAYERASGGGGKPMLTNVLRAVARVVIVALAEEALMALTSRSLQVVEAFRRSSRICSGEWVYEEVSGYTKRNLQILRRR